MKTVVKTNKSLFYVQNSDSALTIVIFCNLSAVPENIFFFYLCHHFEKHNILTTFRRQFRNLYLELIQYYTVYEYLSWRSHHTRVLKITEKLVQTVETFQEWLKCGTRCR